ncbi:T9SS type A sorting domain-containing protein [Kaistella flava (ex Peng et al. 2021)]|uniref:T9SS type A sorting domain-containing protein n=1 Tax=Kaistella flava (ex Peng et al. 2021) TaxID=2038776 RepID=A0A7M2YCY2_9FLAO|nr:T9SS type A sorting domain-containing protein [Kaistella flava (ex Peng et al. 2021)]QOW11322.1 T9SS type A sorting domain-containing protein [Kaistella flava (ex Peng et al. 2021)]
MKNLYVAALFLAGFNLAQSQVYDTGSFVFMTDVSNNGVAAGNVMNAAHLYWTEDAGTLEIGELTSGDYISGYTNVTSDGKFISGTMTNPGTNYDEMAKYEIATGTWAFLGGLGAMSDMTVSSAWGMTGDGSAIVGLAYPAPSDAHAVKWTQAGGVVDLGSTVPNRSSRGNSITDDGTIVVGWQDNDYGDREGVYWKNGVQTYLKDDNGMNTGEAVSVTPDGKTIVGFTFDNPFIWNETEGYTMITHPDPDFSGAASSITDDGKTVVGYFRPWNGQAVMGEGFIYTKEGGRMNLNEYVASLGFDDLGITFALPMAISPNGQYITGAGRTDDDIRGFVIKLPAGGLATANVQNTKMTVYPNPAQDVLYFNNANKVSSIEVYNMVGQKVLSTTAISKEGLDVSKLTKGAYVVKVKTGNQTESVKLIKK